MPTPSKSDPAAATAAEEEKLANALVTRGLLTREEVQQCRAKSGEPAGTEALLGRLVAAGLLTASQSKRVTQELALMLGQQIPGYQLLEKLGQGSMGAVYKGRQISMNRLVAIKLLLPRMAADPRFLERFFHEAHVAAKLSHNNVVQAIDVGSAGKLHYFVMEYVEGTTIRQQMIAGKIYEEREAVDIVLQVARALEHANQRSLVHRDVKPANIILTPDGTAKLADLGLARETSDNPRVEAEKGTTVGTPFYIAPEQILGRPDIDTRADMYALGATLYHMVTGQPPFPGKNVNDLLQAHLEQELTPPDHINTKLSGGLGEVVEVMMAKDRDDRYGTPRDLIVDLECLLAGDPPRLIRSKLETSTLVELTEGEVDEDDDYHPPPPPSGVALHWLILLGGVLVFSVLINVLLLILLLVRK